VIDARNQADALVYQMEKLIADNRERLGPSDVAAVETAVTQAKDAMESGDLNRIRSAIDVLNNASHQVAQSLYGQTGAGEAQQGYGSAQTGGCAGGTCGGGAAPRGDDDFVDAEWREASGG
jgi:molecular chaperone DnaK